jgi:SAM-dependent methyltransferase
MDRQRLSHLAHENHPVACPFSDATVDDLVSRLLIPRTASILDIGCGRGEWLVRVLERHPHAKAVGVDSSEPALESAGQRARDSGVEDRSVLILGDAAEHLANSGTEKDLIICAGSDHALGGAGEAWKRLRSHLVPGGVLLFAQAFWVKGPTPAALQVLGANLNELPVGVAGLVDEVVERGMTPLHVVVSSEREWDDYEWHWISALEEHARSQPDDDAEQLRDAAAGHREDYLRAYRGTLGYAAVIARRAG